VAHEQMKKLLETGKTDLLTGFKSSRTGRVFKAYLVKGPEGKVSFEFEARKPGAVARKTAAKAGEAEAGDGDETTVTALPAKKGAAKVPARKAAAKKVVAKKVVVKEAAARKVVKKVAAKKAA